MNRTNLPLKKPVKRPLTVPILFNYLLVCLMVVCIAAILYQVITRILFGWYGNYMLVIAFLVAFEALLSYRQLAQSALSFTDWLLWRLAEFVVLTFSLKLLLYVFENPAQILTDLPGWQRSFFSSFFSPEFLVAAGYATILWFIATTFADVLYDLEENPALWDLERTGVAIRNREQIRRNLLSHVFVYGAVLLAVTALLNFDLAILPDAVRSIRFNSLIFLAYFVLGLILLAHSQFSMLRARWYLQGIPSSPLIASQWLRYSIFLVMIVALVALLLPTSYSLGLLDILRSIVGVIIYIGLLLQFLLFSPVFWFLNLISRLLNQAEPFQQPPQLPPQQPLPPPSGGSQPWIEVLKSLLFWGIFFAVIIFAFRVYLRQHTDALSPNSRFLPFRWLHGFFNWIQSLYARAGSSVQQAVKTGFAQLQKLSQSAVSSIPNRLPALDKLAPRQQIQFTYLAMLLWMNQKGVERKKSSTPAEYAAKLYNFIPAAVSEIDTMTRLFIEARYSRHPISPEQSVEARSAWAAIQQMYSEQHGSGQGQINP